MRIAIIGTGNVGAALARGLSGKGHDIMLGTREPAAAAALAVETGSRAALPAEAAQAADVIVLALPWAAVQGALAGLGDLTGTIVVDCTNPIGRTETGLGLTVGHTSSGGEIVQGWVPGAHVVKTLNQTGAEIMADARRLSHRPAMFLAGNDAQARATVASLLADLGFEPLDAGDLTRARLLEPLGMVWINQAILRGKGRNWAFAAVS